MGHPGPKVKTCLSKTKVEMDWPELKV